MQSRRRKEEEEEEEEEIDSTHDNRGRKAKKLNILELKKINCNKPHIFST